MRWTQTLIPTLKETPEAAEIPSHVLMLRSGMVSQVMPGAYAYLPLGQRVVCKAEQMIRGELEAVGAVEWSMPRLASPAFWERTGRDRSFGDELMRCPVSRRGRRLDLALAPSHEEVAAGLAARYLSSYRQLPITLYQIGSQFRNESRPRLGVLRTCEFRTVEASRFDVSPEALEAGCREIAAAFGRVLDRCALDHLVAEAGGLADSSREVVIPAVHGEQVVAHCAQCGYTAALDRAEVGPLGREPASSPPGPLCKVDTPGATTIAEVSAMLGCRARDLIKTLIYTTEQGPIAVLIRGDHEASEAKIRAALGVERLELAPPETIERVTGAPVGFAGPVGMRQQIPLWADRGVEGMPGAVVGANQADAHFKEVRLDRDCRVDHFADLRMVVDGDPCPRCSARLALAGAIKVGRTTTWGTRFSEAFGLRFVDERENEHPVAMGSLQLGIDRLLAAAIETGHDDDGIVWPVALAPYEVVVMPLNVADGRIRAIGEELHDGLAERGIDVLLDDRDCRAGVKFKDADLIGVPLRAVIGPRGLEKGNIEIKWRWRPEAEAMPVGGAAAELAAMIRLEREDGVRFKRRRRERLPSRDLGPWMQEKNP